MTSTTSPIPSAPKPPSKANESTTTPYRQIRAHYDEETITVYQAYSKNIAIAAVREQRLDAHPDFKLGRMTWIKPSWCWMMYRSGYGTKDSRQTHILAIRMTHSAFLDLLGKASVTSHGRLTAEEKLKPIRVQWDPERNAAIEVLDYRSIQIGIGNGESAKWVKHGIVSIEDASEMARKLQERIGGKERWDVEVLAREGCMPGERVYEVPADLRAILKMDLIE